MKRLNSHKQNILLVKDDVGKPKPTTRRLPGNQFMFGKPEIRDPEDAGQGKQSKHIVANFIYDIISHFTMALLERQSAEDAGQRL